MVNKFNCTGPISIVFLLLICITLIIAITFIIKAYFKINARQIKKSAKYYLDQNNLNSADSNTITESNNELSKKAFDGVNINPEHKDNKNL